MKWIYNGMHKNEILIKYLVSFVHFLLLKVQNCNQDFLDCEFLKSFVILMIRYDTDSDDSF